MTRPRACQQVQDRASLYLDGRLTARHRAIIEGHLERCAACQRESQAWLLLREQCRSIETEALPTGFGAEIRRAATRRSGLSFSPALRRCAAGFLLVIAAASLFGLGYWRGSRNQPRNSEGAELQLPSPGRLVSREGYLGARSLMADLSVIDHLSPEFRKPLLEADIEHYRLLDWARHAAKSSPAHAPEQGLAELVARLDAALKAPDWQPRLRELQRKTIQGAFWREEPNPFERHRSNDLLSPERRRRTVARVGAQLSPNSRELLRQFLTLKDSLVEQKPLDLVSFSQNDANQNTELAAAVRMNLALGFNDAGLPELAAPLMDVLARVAPEAMGLMKRTLWVQSPPLLRPHSENDLRSRLQSLLDQSDRRGEIQIERKEGKHGSGFHISIHLITPRKH